MNAVFNYFSTIVSNSINLMKGMGITFKYMFEKPVTIQYPDEKAPISDRFRGMLTFHSDTCISCNLCVKACPSKCIELTSKKGPTGKKIIDTYAIDFGKCNWCRLCEEACPTAPLSVHHTFEYELMFESRDDFKITWRNDDAGKPMPPVNLAGKPVNAYGTDHPEMKKHSDKAAKIAAAALAHA